MPKVITGCLVSILVLSPSWAQSAPAPAPPHPRPAAASAEPASVPATAAEPAAPVAATASSGDLAPPPSTSEEVPPPLPPQSRSNRRHDGFYLRMGIGAAYGRVVSEASEGIDFKATYMGAGPAYELLVGGTAASGFVVGGGLLGQDIVDPNLEYEAGADFSGDFDVDDTLGVITLGPFIDWFPDEHGGLHVGALLGIGAIGLQGEDEDETSSGIGGSMFAGYDFWIANQWSLGLEARIVLVSAHHDVADVEFDDTAASYEILFTALYH